MDELIREIQDEMHWYMLFANDIIFINKMRDGLNDKLEKWRHTVGVRRFRLSRLKTE